MPCAEERAAGANEVIRPIAEALCPIMALGLPGSSTEVVCGAKQPTAYPLLSNKKRAVCMFFLAARKILPDDHMKDQD